jgi:XdhC and CoxI family
VDASKLDWRESMARRLRMQATDTGRPAALATAVAISGAAYRRPGAKLLVDERGRTVRAGFVVAQTGTPGADDFERCTAASSSRSYRRPGRGCGKRVMKRHRAAAIAVAWPAVELADVDIPADLERARARQALLGPGLRPEAALTCPRLSVRRTRWNDGHTPTGALVDEGARRLRHD